MNATPRTPLLATKLFAPHLRPRLVQRPHLHAQLAACLTHPLTLVSAPAGFGKTTLVSMWVRTLAQPVGWLALDEDDNDLRRFLTYFAGALQQIDPGLGQSVQELLTTPGVNLDADRVAWIVSALANNLSAQPQACVLVLDDFHLIDSAPVLDVLRSLIAHQPPQLHLVLLTREDPALPLARLRARGQLVELRAQALRFAPDEIARFLHEVMDISLAQVEIDALDARIEGWIAGWQLAALSIQQRAKPADLIAALGGNHPYILSYLTEEVLAQLPPARQDFLCQTSVLTRMSGALCDAVTGGKDGEATLAELERANIFVIPLDDEQHWYRYHHLFADLLRHQLQRTQPTLTPLLLARASAWYEADGQPAEAVDYALAAQDYGRVVRLIETHARQVVLQGYAQTVESWLRRLPEDWRMAGPRANLAFAWSLLLRGHLTQIEPYLHAAEAAAATPQPGSDNEAHKVRAEINALRAGLGAVRGEGEQACALAKAAVGAAPPDDLYLQGMAYFSLGTACNYAEQGAEAIDAYQRAIPLCQATGNVVAAMLAVANLALLYGLRGQLQQAAELCRRTVVAAQQRPGPPPPALTAVYLCYSDLLYQWNDLDPAQVLAERWLEIGKRGGHVATVANGSVICARIYLAQGRVDAATAVMAQTVDLLRVGMPAWVNAQVIAQQVTLALAQGDVDAAASWLRHPARPPDETGRDATDVLHLAQVRLLLARHPLAPPDAAAARANLAQARALVDLVLAAATAGGRMGRALEALVLSSLVHQAQGETAAARDQVTRAVELAAPEGYLRIFVDEGEAMRNLLQAAARQGASAQAYARVLAAFPPQADLHPPPVHPATAQAAQTDLVEALTERELEVLRLIARGLTYQEVAEALVVSLNTVRFHVKGIYGKLGVDRRMNALDRAAALGLL